MAGKTLVESFAGSRYMTPTAREMMLVGEQSGKLETQMRKVSELHMSEAMSAVKVATTVMGVLVVLAVAILIGAIVIKFFMTYIGNVMNEIGI